MSLGSHPLFEKMSGAFNDAFGEKAVPFTLKPDTPEQTSQEFDCIIREEADEMNELSGGSGTQGDYAYLRISPVFGDLLSEEDTLVFKGVTFKIASQGSQDGRSMMLFDLVRVA